MPSITILLHHDRPIDPQAVRELYASIDWWPERSEEEIARVLDETLAIGGHLAV